MHVCVNSFKLNLKRLSRINFFTTTLSSLATITLSFAFRKRKSSRSRRHFFETFVQVDLPDLSDLLEQKSRKNVFQIY
jgi:hypothetical protein